MEARSIHDWIKTLEAELAQADASSQHLQQELWTEFDRYPEFPAAGSEVFEGWIKDRYLRLNNVEFELHLLEVQPGFWSRLRSASRWLFQKKPLISQDETMYQMTSAQDKNALTFTIRFVKKGTGYKSEIIQSTHD